MLTRPTITLFLVLSCLITSEAFAPRIVLRKSLNQLQLSTPPNKVKIDVSFEETADPAKEDETNEEAPQLSAEEQYKRDKLAEIAERKAQEVFMERSTGKYECQACGYIYDEAKGVPKKNIPAGTTFESMDKFRCPECGANKKYFIAETEVVSGFKQNQKYGLGANSLTGEQKGLLIYGGLALGVLIFLSGYLLE